MKIFNVIKSTGAAVLLLTGISAEAQRRAPLSPGDTRQHNEIRNNFTRPDRGQQNNGVRNFPGIRHIPSTASPSSPGGFNHTPVRPPVSNYTPPQVNRGNQGYRYPSSRYQSYAYSNRYHYSNPGRFYYGGAYHPRPSYYRPYRAPSFGIHINILPTGYYPFRYRHRNYYYYGGVFYEPFGGYYQTIAPPLGAVITILPPGAYFSTINNIGYYEYEGTYYEPYGGGYRVAGVNGYLKSDLPDPSDDGDIISDESISKPSSPAEMETLPGDYKTVVLDNITYYVSPSGEYYTKNIDENGRVTYQLSAAATPQK